MKALTPRTLRQYGNDFQSFRDWCGAVDRPALPADSATVLNFVRHELQRGLAVPTIGRRIAAIRHAHLAAGHAVPTEDPRIRGALDESGTAPRLVLSGFGQLLAR
ncbi:MAG: Integrase/recombinase xerD like protein [Rhodospirillales bacterium]|nr:Integrase/recombinase xerD like protein [Rhodospirillales bacterium]